MREFDEIKAAYRHAFEASNEFARMKF